MSGSTVIMYSTKWCGYCQRLKSQLKRAGVAFVEVDIESDDDAASFIEGVNGGNRTVPTVVLPDGQVLTNPPIGVILERLAVEA